MAIVLQYYLLLLILSSSSVILLSGATAFPPAVPPCPPPVNNLHNSSSASPNLTAILSSLLFQQLSTATAPLSSLLFQQQLSTATTTIFAPTDSTLLTCPTCSLPLLLLEHSVPGLYPLHLLRILPFGTKIESLASNRCLTITSTRDTTCNASASTHPTVFVGGVEINRPDLYNDGQVIVHGIQGFVTHLSPLSCQVERMTSLALPAYQANYTSFFKMRLSLQDAMHRLRISGFSLLSLAMRETISDLLDHRSLTVFALDDDYIFSGRGGHAYVANLMLHIVPNRRLMATDLIDLPVNTSFPTMERGEIVVVTVAGGGGLLTPMRINHVKITRANLLYNSRIVVHGVSAPFPRLHQTKLGYWPDQTADVEHQDYGPSETETFDDL